MRSRVRPSFRARLAALVASVLLVAAVSGGCAGGCQRGAPQKPLAKGTGAALIGFYENGIGGFFTGSEGSLKDHRFNLDTVAFRWYQIQSDGALKGNGVNSDILTFARDNGIKTLLSATVQKEVKDPTAPWLASAAGRKKAEDGIAGEAAAKAYYGVVLDFAGVGKETAANLASFVRELATRLHAENRTLGISVRPRVDSPAGRDVALDFRTVADMADYVFLMAFDQHYAAGNPGPIASLGWVETNIRDALKDVPRGKLVLVNGLYAYDWPSSAQTGLTEQLPIWEATERAKRYRTAPVYDPASGESRYSYVAFGQTRTVWIQDGRALRSKLNLAKKYNLGGAALWRLGFEDQSVWEAVKDVFGR